MVDFPIILVPIVLAVVAVLLYQVDPFDPAPFPINHKFSLKIRSNNNNNYEVIAHILKGSDILGSGRLLGPEDIAYERGSHVLYTGCVDGWIKRVELGQQNVMVEDWVNTGGRPLGLATFNIGGRGDIIVADAHKGLLMITKDKEMKVVANEANGKRFKLTDGVDVAKDGIIYFTDASYKYGFEKHMFDILESRPHGRLLCFNPNTQQTTVVMSNLYFPNGLVLSPTQDSLIFCETPLKRCRRYWLEGNKKGSVDTFVDNLPGYPDNIHYDGHNNYLIALSSSVHPNVDQLMKYRVIRKSIAMLKRYKIGLQFIHRNGGIFAVNLQGKPTALFYDPALSYISSAIKVDDHLFIGSLHYQHIIRFNLSYSSS